MHLPRQLGPLHDLPDSPEAYDAVLAGVVEEALARLTPEGSLEHPDRVDDIGDTSLGITSLLALAWQRGRDPRLPEAVRRSLAFHLRERVYTEDNPGYPNLKARASALPYARYTLASGAHPIGDWPSTVWALLQTVNVLELAEGLVEGEQRAELLDVAHGYWRWLTEATFFNPQEAGNQAIGCVVGGLMLARHLPPGQGEQVRARAIALYVSKIRDHRVADRGALLPPEHGGAYDNNYGPISLSFLAQAHRVSGERVFAEDGDALARYIDARLTNGGFDNGGPRYSEQHSAFESVLGLRYFSRRIGSDLGRYRGDSRWGRHAVQADGGVDGHFAWMLVWQIQDTTRWHRSPSPLPARHQLRAGTVSVAFDDRMTPSLVEAAGTYYLPAAVNRQHGFGPVTDGFLFCRPMGEVRVRDVRAGGLTAKLVTKPVVGRDHVLRHVRSLYVTDGTSLWVTVAVEQLPGTPYLLAGLPYATDDGDRVRRTADGDVTSAGALRLTHPQSDGVDHFDARADRTQEEAAFALAADPRGYGNPDEGWRHLVSSTALEAEPAPGAPEELHVFAVRYGPSGPFGALSCERDGSGLKVRTDAFTALIGEAAGDAHGEPELTLKAS
ncbi:hypothetical protein ACM01_00265 [Streptomyces viridochromogenes]|uniref:Uncharacterized protein n=1 Tax=Streptomyces viridochromogenes TaxID=1938 RepID=A0A0J7ZNZ8_STRVR|nr:hypothetical protein [Streptomyces viridochromogenes]KMS77117.1 hypothetical protein ACM01_00265 [Streptomyces viridochromogenes]KOG09360.1 hypothetical protein ADK35_40010 [Streptomyces viridochromogenes]KOG27267.1 hypothetical protein ADK36_01575 [Streptomyces viridochromogenes]